MGRGQTGRCRTERKTGFIEKTYSLCRGTPKPFFDAHWGRLCTEEFRFGEAVDPNVDPFTAEGLEKLLRDETKNKYEPYVPKTDALSVLPPIKFKANESQQIQTISVELANYVKESAVRFIMGDLNLDADWNKYVESLNNIGLEQYLETYQKAYDRQYKRIDAILTAASSRSERSTAFF